MSTENLTIGGTDVEVHRKKSRTFTSGYILQTDVSVWPRPKASVQTRSRRQFSRAWTGSDGGSPGSWPRNGNRCAATSLAKPITSLDGRCGCSMTQSRSLVPIDSAAFLALDQALSLCALLLETAFLTGMLIAASQRFPSLTPRLWVKTGAPGGCPLAGTNRGSFATAANFWIPPLAPVAFALWVSAHSGRANG